MVLPFDSIIAQIKFSWFSDILPKQAQISINFSTLLYELTSPIVLFFMGMGLLGIYPNNVLTYHSNDIVDFTPSKESSEKYDIINSPQTLHILFLNILHVLKILNKIITIH
eukprot:UN00422